MFEEVAASQIARHDRGFQVSTIFSRWFHQRKSRIQRRLDKRQDTLTFQPVFSASNIHYEVSQRTGAITCGGLGAMHRLVRQLGLIEAIDTRLHLLRLHLPYHESDHVLTIVYNALCDGTCLQDLELRRHDENFLNALGAKRLPDPTTAGDFCRRFTRDHIFTLIDLLNDTRLRVWADQPDRFFDCATIDLDGSLVATTGQCKGGMDIAYDGTWGYHPLVVTLANTGEVLSLINRPGNRPSHEDAAREVDRALLLCVRAGFRKIVFRGDTDFSQSERLDGWDHHPRVRFFFGYDALPNLKEMAENLPKTAWRPLATAAATGERQGTSGQAAGIPEHRVGFGRRDGVRLPAGGLPPNLPDGGGAQEPLGGEGRARAVPRRAVFLLHHQRTDLHAGGGGL